MGMVRVGLLYTTLVMAKLVAIKALSDVSLYGHRDDKSTGTYQQLLQEELRKTENVNEGYPAI